MRPVQFGFRFPGTVNDFGGARGQPAVPRWIRRYHPITEGFADSYQIAFRFGQNESFRDLTRDAWRWAWNTLNPPVNYIDVDQVRQVLLDHLEAQAVTIDGRTGIPFARSTVVDTPNWNWTMIAMGFVGKNLECANQLLLEGDRDKTRARTKNARDRPRHHRLHDSSASCHSVAGHRIRPGVRQTVGSLLAGSLAAQCHRGYAGLMQAYRRELALGRAAPRMACLGEVLLGLADPAAAGRWLVPTAVEAGKQRGRRAYRDREL